MATLLCFHSFFAFSRKSEMHKDDWILFANGIEGFLELMSQMLDFHLFAFPAWFHTMEQA